MSFFRSSKSANITPSYTGMSIQTSSSALPIPIIYGVTRAAPNIIWHDGFETHAQYSSSGGGKGGGHTVSSYTYSTWIMLGVGEGPIGAIGTIYTDQSTYPYGAYYLSLMDGSTPQDVWGQVTSNYTYAALNYNGTAYMASSYYDLGTSASIGSLAFEVYGRLQSTHLVNLYDADPAQMIYDFLTNAQYGVGFPAASIDASSLLGASGDASYQTYCAAIGIGLSPALTDQEAANSILARWLQLTNAAAVWSGGMLKFIPYGDTEITANSRTFVPNITPIFDLTDDDYIYDGTDDPVQCARSDPFQASNVQTLECFNRGYYYTATPVQVFDQSAIERFGLRMGSTITAHEICDLDMGIIAAQLILQRGLYIRNTYTFKLSFEYCILDPMDIVTLTDSALGLDQTPVRITSIEEDSSGILTVTAEEFPGGIATATQYPVSGSAGSTMNRNVDPGSVNAPIIFEPPSSLSGGVAQVWAAVSGGASGAANSNWGGAYVWASLDGTNYSQIGTVTAAARMGSLAAALPAGLSPDTTNTLAVTLAESGGTLGTATESDAQNGATLCYVGGELLAYGSVTLTATNAYNLTYLVRGLSGSTAAAHASGAAFARLDDAIFKYDLPGTYIGQTIHLKFQSFNVFGGAVQDLSDCTDYTYEPLGGGSIGAVLQALSVGTSIDLGLASGFLTETDSCGFGADPYSTTIDLGSSI